MEKERLTSLVERSQQGDRDALNELISECYEGFYYFALKTVKDENVAADVTQESCIVIMTSLDKLREPVAFITWSRQIIYHQCARYFKAPQDIQVDENEDGETMFDRLPDDNPDVMPEQVYEDKEFRQTMQDLLASLPAEQRSALLLYYYEKLSVKEIAEVQGVTEGTIKSRLNYGRKAVKKKVEEYEEQTGVKLHSAAPIALLLFHLFKQGAAELPVLPPMPPIPGIAAAASVAAGTAATATVAAETTAGAVGTVAESIGVAAGEAVVKAVGTSIAAKVIAGVIAAVAVLSAAISGIVLTREQPYQPDEEQEEDGTGSSDGHTHDYSAQYAYDEVNHWRVCECGKHSQKSEHDYDGRVCTVCNRKKASEGLYMVKNEDHYLVGGIGSCTDTDIVFPSEYEGLPVIGFDGWAMEDNTTVVSVEIPNTFTRIGNRVFWGCTSLRSVRLPEGLLYIDEYAFWDCASLTDINLPDSLVSIGHLAFDGCTSLTKMVIPDKVGTVGTGTFYECTSLTEISLPAKLHTLSLSAFHKCMNLQDVYFRGTKQQWNDILCNETSWEFNDWSIIIETGDYTIHCTDGDIDYAEDSEDY